MKAISAYLNWNGKTEEAFNFYKSVFGGEFSALQRFKDMPGAEKTPEKEKNWILHIALPLGKAGVLMGSDTPESRGMKVVHGNNVHLMIDAESEQEAERLFMALSAGGKVMMPLQKQFWGALYASLTDKFRVNWMINYGMEQPS
jgi:PhnB protein